jgi:hypothetical protein
VISDEERTEEPKSAVSSNGFFFPIANLLFMGDGASDISKCLLVVPTSLLRLA